MAFEINRLTVYRASKRILHEISLRLEPGELLGLLGPNGAGKSSLLSAMAGELPLAAQTVFIDEQSLDALNAFEQAQRRAVLPQMPGLNFDFSVREIIEMGAYPFEDALPDQVQAWTEQALTDADITNLHDRRYTQLSGGEQQRVQFARILMQCYAILANRKQAYLLLDEPLSGLDPRHQVYLMTVVERFAHEHGLGILIIVHDLNLAARWCDRIALLSEQEITAVGPPESVLTQENIAKVFGMDMVVVDHPLVPGKLLVLHP